MKALLYFCLLILPFAGNGQKSVNKFIDQVKKADHAVAMSFPGWLIRSGSRMAFDFSEEEDVNGYYELSQNIKGLRFVIVEKGFTADPELVHNFIEDIQAKEGFEPYVRARDKGKNINVFIKEEGDKIKNLVVMVNGEDNIIVANLQTDFTLEQLKKAKISFNKHHREI